MSNKNSAKAQKRNLYPRLVNAQLQRFLAVRYGRSEWPDDDAGRDDLWLAVHHLAVAGKDELTIRAFIKRRAPWLAEPKTAEMLDRAFSNKHPYGAAKLGERLGLTAADRMKYRLWHIEAIDCAKPERIKQAKKRKAERRKQRRRERGVKPRDEYLAQSVMRTKPWIALGIASKRSYYRWLAKQSGTGLTPVSCPYPAGGRHTCAIPLVSSSAIR